MLRLSHRGPDQHGRALVEAPGGRPLLIGQTRLNVVYKEDVPTPMTRDGSLIAFNGEIYNWAPLRAELEAKGHVFTTPTDTEVVLAAYLEWGAACLERFNGMFAFAIWHEATGELFLARDRVGKKPLFWLLMFALWRHGIARRSTD
jgi:asparagine synthase (glutamine-hydrolysing)